MWDSLLDYGKVEWKHTLAMIQKYPKKKSKLLELFDKTWCLHQVICVKDEKKIRWCYQLPLVIVSCGNCWGFGSQGWMSSWVCCVCTSLFYNRFFQRCMSKKTKQKGV